ncbi:O-antigen polysaccharide polymerase Wzy [Candidatus Pacearchaeota archaeon]|nr:O-antigen polysaccharide polymerase Wzy [Candidatus Pacearchaeota archaeon]
MSISHLLGMDVLTFDSSGVADINIFTKVIQCHIVAILFFTLTYIFIGSRQKLSRLQDVKKGDLANNKIWITLFVAAFLFVLVAKLLLGTHYTRWDGGSARMTLLYTSQHSLLTQQITGLLSKISNILCVFAAGVIISRSKTLMKARLMLILTAFVVLAFNFTIYASRGPAIIFFSAGAYADRVRWNGRLLNWRLLLTLLVGGLLMMHIVNLCEGYAQSGVLAGNFKGKVFTALEPRVVSNAGTIINWVDSGEVQVQYGASYLMAAKSILPTQLREKKLQPLTEWFAWKLSPIDAAQGAGYGFSMIAEGYLNGKMFGVAIHGVIIGLFVSSIRYLKFSAKYNNYTILLYSSLIPLIYKFYRADLLGLVKRIQWNMTIVFLLVLVALTIRQALKTYNLSRKNRAWIYNIHKTSLATPFINHEN